MTALLPPPSYSFYISTKGEGTMQATQSTDDQLSTPAGLEEAEALTNELKRLLVHSETALNQEGVREHAEKLEHWMESYRRGLTAAHKLSEKGPEFLHEIRDRLSQAQEELHRLEGEGGMPATKDQTTQMEEFSRAIRRIDKLANSLERASFTHAEPERELERELEDH
jgi:hypothetical protein